MVGGPIELDFLTDRQVRRKSFEENGCTAKRREARNCECLEDSRELHCERKGSLMIVKRSNANSEKMLLVYTFITKMRSQSYLYP